MSSIKPNEDRAKAAYLTVLMVTGVRILVGIIHFNFYLYTDYSDPKNPFVLSPNEITETFQMVKILTLIEVVIFIVSLVLFIRWFRRAFYNIEQVNPNLNGHNEETVYSWMIPVWNMFRPYQLMRELYQVSRKILLDSGRELMANKLSQNVLNLWWSLWILQSLNGMYLYLNNAIFLDYNRFVVIDIYFINPIINLLLGIVTFRLIWDYNVIQPELTKSMEESSNDNFVQSHLVE